jgi:hypothetical protein
MNLTNAKFLDSCQVYLGRKKCISEFAVSCFNNPSDESIDKNSEINIWMISKEKKLIEK